VPRTLKVRYGHDRLKDIRSELVRLARDKYPNAGAVMLRVFLEIAVIDYLTRTGELPGIIKKIQTKGAKVSFGVPTMRQLVPEISRIADQQLSHGDAVKVKKAVHYDASAPFTVSELHGFVHHTDFPSPRDILQFWNRTEPLFRLMLEQAPPTTE
jgi:hypothetical protein